MTNPEHVEKSRQAIMRMKELLEILRVRLEEGEQAYDALFTSLSPEDLALREKDRQTKAAYLLLEDPERFSRAVLHMRFTMRDLERDFEQLYDNLPGE